MSKEPAKENRAHMLRVAAGYVAWYADARDSMKDKVGAERARRIRTELLNMADELSDVDEYGIPY